MRSVPLLIGVGLFATAALVSQAAAQGATKINVSTSGAASKVDAAKLGASSTGAIRIGAAKAIENEVEGRLGKMVQKLAVGSDVFRNQLVRTGNASTAELQFLDETDLHLSPLTQIKLDSFVYDPDKKTGKVALYVPRGLVRFITGTMAKRNYSIRTSFVAVGVRGTIFDMLVRTDRVTVLLIEGGVELTVEPRGPVYVLDRANTAITIWRDGRVIGPRDWTRSITDFAALPAPPVQRRAAVPAQPQPGRPGARQAAVPAAAGVASSAGGGGGTSAMDRLSGGTGTSSMNTISGNQVLTGAAASQPAIPRRAAGGGRAGSSSSSGYDTARSIPVRTRPTRTPTPTPASGNNDQIDYGACGGCGKQQDNLNVR